MLIDLKNAKTTTMIEIPDFDGVGEVEVEVRRPRLMDMLMNDTIPNPLRGTALEVVQGFRDTSGEENREHEVKRSIEAIDLYCEMCLVNPTFAQFKDVMTDEQKTAIAAWAAAPAELLRSFREEQENSSNNKDVSEV